MVVKVIDFGLLVEHYVKGLLRYNSHVATGPHGTDAQLREWWPKLDEYSQRHIQVAIEMSIEMDKYPPPAHSNRQPLQDKELWIKFLQDFRPGKSAFTVDYHCGKCKTKEVKLWRGVHGCADKDGNELLCADCLAPGVVVDDKGTWDEPLIPGSRNDQVKGWLPAIPVDDIFWGYSSAPSQDIEWWQALPTYAHK